MSYCQVCQNIGFHPKCEFCGRRAPKPKPQPIEGINYITIHDGTRKTIMKKSKFVDEGEKEDKRAWKEEMRIHIRAWNQLKMLNMTGTGVASYDDALRATFGDWKDKTLPEINADAYLKGL